MDGEGGGYKGGTEGKDERSGAGLEGASKIGRVPKGASKMSSVHAVANAMARGNARRLEGWGGFK
eukprot:40850-Pleurochrysis_carterae.AAC.1